MRSRELASARKPHSNMSNRLASETSPYLLQHAENPVDWYPWGDEALGRARARAQADPRLDRLRRLPLVPRDGARVLRGPEVAALMNERLRLHQGRPRGAPGRRRDLHGRRPGDDRPRRLAAERVPDARGRSVLRGHLLAARAAPEACPPGRRSWSASPTPGSEQREEIEETGRRILPRLAGAARARAGRGASSTRRRSTPRSPRCGAATTAEHGGFSTERAEVPRRIGDRVPAAPRRAPDGAAHAARDGLGRRCTTRSAAASPATRSTRAG